jgi:hypothetical protein
VRESRPRGSVRGAAGNGRPYREKLDGPANRLVTAGPVRPLSTALRIGGSPAIPPSFLFQNL